MSQRAVLRGYAYYRRITADGEVVDCRCRLFPGGGQGREEIVLDRGALARECVKMSLACANVWIHSFAVCRNGHVQEPRTEESQKAQALYECVAQAALKISR